MSYRLARTTLAVALSSSLLLLSVGAGMSVAASPTTPVKPSIQGGGPGGGGDDADEANEGNEGAEHTSGRVEGKGQKAGGKKRGTHVEGNEGNEGAGTGGGLVNKAAPGKSALKPNVAPTTSASAGTNLKSGATKVTPKATAKVAPKVTPKIAPKVAPKIVQKPVAKPVAKVIAKPKIASA